MLSEDTIENRHAPPGVNSRSMAASNSDDADLEVLREIENIYFSNPSDFDATLYTLENIPKTEDDIEKTYLKLKRQHQVVSSKALHLISQQRENCDREFLEIQKIRENITDTLSTCQKARSQLDVAKQNLTLSTFVILANFRKRQLIKTVLKSLELLQNLRSVEHDVADLLQKKEYEQAITLILKSLKAAAAHKQFDCIKDLAIRLQDNLDTTEEKLDQVLSNICYDFDESVFTNLRKAYTLLGKTQAAMDQLHVHYSSAINDVAIKALNVHVKATMDAKFQDLCQAVPINKAPVCLLELCENLFVVMRSYYLLVEWHLKNDDTVGNATVFDIEKNVSNEYIRQKLQAGLARIWLDVQTKVSTFLKNSSLEEYPFEKFVQMLGMLRKLTQVAEVFCGDKSDLLQEFIKNHSVSYIKNYHKGRMDELRLFLENEGWEQCPVKSSFNITNLQEFKPFKKYLNSTLRSDLSMKQSDGASSSQDNSVYLKKVFTSKNRSPFAVFRDESLSYDDIFGVELESDVSESDDEPDELKQEFLEEEHSPKTAKKDSVIVTNTTLSVLRNCGQYLQICRYLPQISLEVILLMNQLFEYYFYTVHLFFTSDLEVNTTTLYTQKLNATLKRISNLIDSTDDTKIPSPVVPNFNRSEATIHGLNERVVAVESVIFLAKQYEMLQPYLENIVDSHQNMILDHFRDNTLASATDLRAPIYMASVSKSVDAKSVLIAMSNVKWDVKDVAVEHSSYVEILVRKIQVFAIRLDEISATVSMKSEVLISVWAMLSKFVMHLLVEGFSNATKCSNAGRGLMQLDFRQLLMKLEKISNMKPIPYQDYVDRYVKAYYLPRNSLEEFIKERNEYSNKHLFALITCACDNKRDRQELQALIDLK